MTDPLERFARVTPPRTHVRQVLERSGPGAGRRRAVPLLRWLVPAATCLVVMAGALVTIGTTRFDAPLVVPPTSGDWSGKGVDVPVLPPRAYWEMSAIEEFERLRPAQTRSRVTSRTMSAAPASAAASSFAARDVARLPAADMRPPLAPIEIDAIETTPVAIEALAAPTPIDIAPVVIEPVMLSPLTQEEE